ncbi:MAG: hypothetical protein ACYDIC_15615 [Desulfobaccales bacterium]
MGEFYSWKRSDLPAELNLILACLRITPNEKEVRRIEELSRSEIAWPAFLEGVDRHRVAPLVYTNLSRYAGKTLPSAIVSALRSRFEGNAHAPLAQGVILAHELLDVPLPEAIRTYALQDRMVSYSTQVAHRFILDFQPEKPALSSLLMGHLCNLRCAHSAEEKLNILHRIFTGADWFTLPLPAPLFFLNYFLRFPLWLQRRWRVSRKQMGRYETTHKNGA